MEPEFETEDAALQERLHDMGIEQVLSAPRSPWQNPFVERLIGTLRCDCLDHVIILNDRHLRHIVGRCSSQMGWPALYSSVAPFAGKSRKPKSLASMAPLSLYNPYHARSACSRLRS